MNYMRLSVVRNDLMNILVGLCMHEDMHNGHVIVVDCAKSDYARFRCVTKVYKPVCFKLFVVRSFTLSSCVYVNGVT